MTDRKRRKPQREPVVLDTVQRRAGKYLARCGYKKGSGRRSGAVTGAADAIGVHRDTVYGWLEIPEFVEFIDNYNDTLNDLWGQGAEDLLAGKITETVTVEQRLDRQGNPITLTKTEQHYTPPNAQFSIYFGKLNGRDEMKARDLRRQAHEKEMAKLNAELKNAPEPELDIALPVIEYIDREEDPRLT